MATKSCNNCQFAIGSICTWGQKFQTPPWMPMVSQIEKPFKDCQVWAPEPTEEETPGATGTNSTNFKL